MTDLAALARLLSAGAAPLPNATLPAASLPPQIPLQIISLPPALQQTAPNAATPLPLNGMVQLDMLTKQLQLPTAQGTVMAQLGQLPTTLTQPQNLTQLVKALNQQALSLSLSLGTAAGVGQAALLLNPKQLGIVASTNKTADTPKRLTLLWPQGLQAPVASAAATTGGAWLRQLQQLTQQTLPQLLQGGLSPNPSLPGQAALPSGQAGANLKPMAAAPSPLSPTATLPLNFTVLPNPNNTGPTAAGERTPLQATYLGKNPQGQNQFQIGDKILVQPPPQSSSAPLPWPVGTKLFLKPELGYGELVASLTGASPNLPTIEKIRAQLALLPIAELPPALQTLARLLPASQNVPTLLVQWLAVLRQQEQRPAGEWQERLQSLARARPALEETTSDLARLLSLREQVASDWRSYPLPLPAGWPTAHFFVHDDGRQSEQSGALANKPKRFLIDITFTHLGDLQLDGLTQPKRLDLVVRSLQVLPATLQTSIAATYYDQLSALGLTGELSFQTGHQHWLQPRTLPRLQEQI